MLPALALLLAIAPHAIRGHIHFLASDALEGREAGKRGHEVAAAYVAAQFEAIGAAPAGDGGTYLQPVTMRTSLLDPAKSSFAIDGKTFAHRQDVLINTLLAGESHVEADVVFAGFGVTAPELGHDDYANLDVRGKVVAFLSGAPPRFPHSQRAYYSSTNVKFANATARGAIGTMSIRTHEQQRRSPWERAILLPDAPTLRALDPAGQPMENFPQIRGSVSLGPAAMQALFAGEPQTLEAVLADAEKSIAHPFAMKKRVAIHTTSNIGTVISPNVVAMVRGSALPDELVVVTAHLDHMGLTETGEDRVRNGALDNASGIAALLEIARNVAALEPRPRRTIVFAAVTAEESGGAGSLTFAMRPSVPGTIVANVNMDMITMLFPLKSLVALGMEHSSLGPLAREAATRNGFVLEDDPLPEEVRFIRSDQYSFVKRGIPAITYKGGLMSSDPSIDGDAITRTWLREVYHTVDDEPGPQLHYASGARWAQTNLDLVLLIANADARPRWNDGDFFAKTFSH